jgi:ABC-type transport system involved in multi-copper enzyme maturation permease subunit
VNRALIVTFLRQRLSSVMRITLLFLAVLFPLGIVYANPMGGLSGLGGSLGIALILSAGLIGQDLSSGVLQLLFARPIRRSEYVLNRWLAAASAATALSIARILVAAIILAARGMPASASSMAITAGNDAITAFGITAVITLFSSLVGGFGDLALLFVSMISSQMLQGLGGLMQNPVVSRAGAELEGFLNPHVELAQCLTLSAFPWFMVVSYASTVALCLALAIVAMNQRELSYASAG